MGVLGVECGLLGRGCFPGKPTIRTRDDQWLDVVAICLLIVLILVLIVGWPVRGIGRHSIPLARYSPTVLAPIVAPVVVPIFAIFVFSFVVLVLAFAPKGPLVPHFVFSFSEIPLLALTFGLNDAFVFERRILLLLFQYLFFHVWRHCCGGCRLCHFEPLGLHPARLA